MKYKLPLLIFLFILTNIAFGQTGTIKVAKPKEIVSVKKDSIISSKKRSYISADLGANYTFKNNNKVGFEAGILYSRDGLSFSYRFPVFIGIQYSYQNVYYKLSSFNKLTQQTESGYSKSQNQSQFIKIPINVQTHFAIANLFALMGIVEVTPQYLLKNKNEFERLYTNDFNRFNLAGSIGFSFVILKYRIGFKYSKDIFENLKNRSIYDSSGTIISKQKSKTNLLTFIFSYPG